MPRRNQASQSQPTSSNNAASQAQGSTNQPYEVSVEKTTRNQEIWCHFDLVRMSDGTRRARCKACNTYINADGNSTLKKHTNNHCKATKGTTGKTKRVKLSHRNLISTIVGAFYGRKPRSSSSPAVHLSTVPYFHVYGFMLCLRMVAFDEVAWQVPMGFVVRRKGSTIDEAQVKDFVALLDENNERLVNSVDWKSRVCC
ncbi:AMP-dependent synthetase/ligase, AMP-binding enzyme C-terminal domain protein [Artemisia annua]|uniref:AMP-dependent synthetase/ligase, AMP-binding enzyme C-terminal domain protein n=1 Tax=Artemisia annua TaxID=35608 RepID=A0A2U1KG03_ARTAN|nr:AMP-dependent synthetase/ligase, AMP-binding enzyme C-terminal domain protein [Artemisia annua]